MLGHFLIDFYTTILFLATSGLLAIRNNAGVRQFHIGFTLQARRLWLETHSHCLLVPLNWIISASTAVLEKNSLT